MALWFSDLAKIPEIKVCLTLFLLSCFGWFTTVLATLFSFQFLYKFSLFLSETHFEGVPLLQRRVLRSEPSLVRSFFGVQQENVWPQA